MTEPAVAVAISTRDRPASLRRCLASLRAGTTLPTEVVVSDQSSGEATRAIVDAASACLPIRYIRARPGGLGRRAERRVRRDGIAGRCRSRRRLRRRRNVARRDRTLVRV